MPVHMLLYNVSSARQLITHCYIILKHMCYPSSGSLVEKIDGGANEFHPV